MWIDIPVINTTDPKKRNAEGNRRRSEHSGGNQKRYAFGGPGLTAWLMAVHTGLSLDSNGRIALPETAPIEDREGNQNANAKRYRPDYRLKTTAPRLGQA